MTNDFDIIATHSCGHEERHTGGTTGDIQGMYDHFATRKCSACHPTCRYCHRSGDKEHMLVLEDGKAFCKEWCHEQWLNPTHYREHNAIAIPGFLRHWQDHSYHNDSCANSSYEIGKAVVRVWVEMDDPEERDSMSCGKYSVQFYPDDQMSDDSVELYNGEDAAIVALWAHAAEIVRCGTDTDDDPAAQPMIEAIRKLMAAE